MRRLWLPLLVAVLLAACSSVPQQNARRVRASPPVANAERPPGFPNFVDHSVGREEISIQAMGLVGIPYRWGGNTPDSGFDCSGLVRYVVARAASVSLPRTTAEMSGRGESVEPDEIAAGDLVYFNTTGRPHSHVGIYVGKLRFVNAPSTGGTVRLDYLTNPYWAKRFDGIRRVAPARQAPTLFDAPTWEASAPPSVPVTPVAATAAASAIAARPANEVPPPVVAAAQASDPFEPPPDAMRSAQDQARAAGAVTAPVVVASPALPPDTRATSVTSPTDAPDPIDAAADAFEPPPPAAVAARQAAQADARPVAPVAQAGAAPAPRDPAQPQILRASTSAPAIAAPTQSNDDPIARFANSGF